MLLIRLQETNSSPPHKTQPPLRVLQKIQVPQGRVRFEIEQTVSCWLHNGLQRYQFLISGTCKCYPIWKKGLCKCNEVKSLQVRIIQVGLKCNHLYPYKSGRGRCNTNRREGAWKRWTGWRFEGDSLKLWSEVTSQGKPAAARSLRR